MELNEELIAAQSNFHYNLATNWQLLITFGTLLGVSFF